MTEIQKLINHKPKAFAERLGIPLSTVSKWSNGTHEPSKWQLRMIKKELKK